MRLTSRLLAAAAVAGLAACASSPETAQAPAKADPCVAAAVSATDHAICANPDLRAADNGLREALWAARAYAPKSEQPLIDRAQTAWTAERDRVCPPAGLPAPCLKAFERRTAALEDQARAGQKRLAAIVAEIPQDSGMAAKTLATYDRGGAAKAWLIYLYQTGAVPVADKAAEIRRLAKEITETGLPDDPYLLEEIRNLGDLGAADTATTLFFLRHVLSTTDMEAPCFLFTAQGVAAFEAFGPFWGNARDTRPALCRVAPTVYDLPAWRSIAARLDRAVEPALAERGSIRHAYERQFRIDGLQATLAPVTLLDPPASATGRRAADTRRLALDAMRNGTMPGWTEADRRAMTTALPSAIKAISGTYQKTLKLPAKLADSVAQAAADRFIADRVQLLAPDEQAGE